MLVRAFTLALILCALGAGQSPAAPAWKYANPNSKSLIGLHVRAVRQFLEPGYLEHLIGNIPGLDLATQVDSVLISSPGLPEDDDSSEPPVLLIVQGRFDLDRLRRVLKNRGAKPQAFDSVTVYRPQGKAAREFGVALLDSSTILAGDAQSVFSAIERRQTAQSEPAGDLMVRAMALSQSSDVWAVMSHPGAMAGPLQGLSALGVTGLELSMSLKGGLALNGSLETGSEAEARTLRDQLKELLKVAGKDQPIAKKLKLDLDGAVLRFSSRLGQNEAQASFRGVVERFKPEQTVVAESKPVTPDKPLVIRIEGLDEGAREVKYAPSP